VKKENTKDYMKVLFCLLKIQIIFYRSLDLPNKLIGNQINLIWLIINL